MTCHHGKVMQCWMTCHHERVMHCWMTCHHEKVMQCWMTCHHERVMQCWMTCHHERVMQCWMTCHHERVMQCWMTCHHERVMQCSMTCHHERVKQCWMTCHHEKVMQCWMTCHHERVMQCWMTCHHERVMQCWMTCHHERVMQCWMTCHHERVMQCSMTCHHERVMQCWMTCHALHDSFMMAGHYKVEYITLHNWHRFDWTRACIYWFFCEVNSTLHDSFSKTIQHCMTLSWWHLTELMHVLVYFLVYWFVQGDLVGFKGELMHVFNKNENIVHQSDYFDNLSHRHNVILMGDSLGDLGMADGAICDSILRIGFLNGDDVSRLYLFLIRLIFCTPSCQSRSSYPYILCTFLHKLCAIGKTRVHNYFLQTR